MANDSLTAKYDELPKIARILLQIFLGWLIGGVYRILRWTETKNTTTLVAGVLAFIPPIGFVVEIVDLVTVILNDKITVLAD